MVWKISGELIETCSCNMLCPCWFGEADLMLMDQGWCATLLLLRIRDGDFEGANLAGQNAVVGFHFPGPTLYDANGTGRVYTDENASEDQRIAIETILQGGSGGGMEVPASLVSNWLPSKAASIEVSENDGKIKARIGDIGKVVSRRLVNELGNKMTMQNSAFSMAFQFDDHHGDLSPSNGTSWKDTDMPVAWEGKSGVAGQVSWSG